MGGSSNIITCMLSFSLVLLSLRAMLYSMEPCQTLTRSLVWYSVASRGGAASRRKPRSLVPQDTSAGAHGIAPVPSKRDTKPQRHAPPKRFLTPPGDPHKCSGGELVRGHTACARADPLKTRPAPSTAEALHPSKEKGKKADTTRTGPTSPHTMLV